MPRVGGGSDHARSGQHIFLVVALWRIDHLRLDLAHVPGHEAIAGLTEFDHLLRLQCLLGKSSASNSDQGECGGDLRFDFHVGLSVVIVGNRVNTAIGLIIPWCWQNLYMANA
jgi:hypothetical protein